MAEENRKTRFSIRFEVVFDDGESFMSGPVLDVSETGCFIETVMPLPPGKRVRLTPLLDGQAGDYELEGEVVRANEYEPERYEDGNPGMGVRFIDPHPDFVAALQKALEEGRG